MSRIVTQSKLNELVGGTVDLGKGGIVLVIKRCQYISNTTFYYKIYLYNTPIYERLTSNLTNHI